MSQHVSVNVDLDVDTVKDLKTSFLISDLRRYVLSIPSCLALSKDTQMNSLDYLVFNFRPTEDISPTCISTSLEDHDVKLEYFCLLKWLFNGWYCVETVVLERKVDEEHLPRQLLDTMLVLSKEFEREPILTYEDYILFNHHEVNGATVPMYTFTDLYDEVWFIQIHIYVEREVERVMNKLREINFNCDSKSSFTFELVEGVLQRIVDSKGKAGAALLRMTEHCSPHAFLNTVRKFFPRIPKRYFFEGETGTYAGASGAQASFEPLIDAFLGVKFVKEDPFNFHMYMPPDDRKLLKYLHTCDAKTFIESLCVPTAATAAAAASSEIFDVTIPSDDVSVTSSTSTNSSTITMTTSDSIPSFSNKVSPHEVYRLKLLYDEAIDSMVLFRENHIAFIGSYIPGQQGTGGTGGFKPLRDRCRDTEAMKFYKTTSVASDDTDHN